MTRTHYDLEIDLHGCHVDEALARLEHVLYRPEPQSILVIHGNGTGTLRKAVREFVQHNSYIREYYWGEEINAPGGDGCIVIYT